MSTIKTKVDQAEVESFLKEQFDSSAGDVVQLAGGELSQAFAFSSGGHDLVIRVNTSLDGFKKDSYAASYIASSLLPIPETVELGKFSDTLFYSITKRVPGTLVSSLSTEEYASILPELLSTLDVIHATDIRDTSGYGRWDAEGLGEYDSWKEFILPTDIDVDAVCKNSCMEKDVWDKVYAEISKLATYCPEDRFLVHGDFGFDTVMIDEHTIIGVFDWARSMYGDFLYDVAWLSFWSGKLDPGNKAEEFYKDMLLPFFDERIKCYKLHIGLSSMATFAMSGQEEKYTATKNRTLQLLG